MSTQLIKIKQPCKLQTCKNIIDVYSPEGRPVNILCKECSALPQRRQETLWKVSRESRECHRLQVEELLDEE